MPKHLSVINGETLLQRLVRQIRALDKECQIIITSRNPNYYVSGAVLHTPLNNQLEIDRFTWELIEDNTCFLYGDTYYTDEAIRRISNSKTAKLLFFGNESSIIAVICGNAQMMKSIIKKIKKDYKERIIPECKGMQVYGYYLKEHNDTNCFIEIKDDSQGFNTVEEYETFLQRFER